MSQAISNAAVAEIVRFEVSSKANYERSLARLTWPQGQSGITGGIGYDFGYETRAQLNADWGDILPPNTIGRLAAITGITGTAARDELSTVADIVIPYDAAMHVFEHRNIPRYADLTSANFNTIMLSPDSFGAMVSLVFNRGADWGNTDRRHEMYMIHTLLATDKLAAVPAQFRAMKRLWPDLPGLVARREDEALLFIAGLAKLKPVAFVPSAPFVSYVAPDDYTLAAMSNDNLRYEADRADAAVAAALAAVV